MNKNEKPFSLKRKGAAVGLVVCFVAAIVMVGAYTFNNYDKKMNDQLAKAEQETKEATKEKSEATTTNDIVLPEADGSQAAREDTEGTTGTDNSTASTDGTAQAVDTNTLSFSEDSVLAWPASGAVLMNYSMDQTVYFATLEQYKYNPALIVGGEVGETIAASASGIVTDIQQDAKTGLTVTLDMGNGYTAIYGQLKEVPVQIGDYVDNGAPLGYLSEPTKYYSVEGPNLYFEILKDDAPVDPMNYIES